MKPAVPVPLTVPTAYMDGLDFDDKRRQRMTNTAVLTHRYTGSLQGLVTKKHTDGKGSRSLRIGHWLSLPNGEEQNHHILNIELGEPEKENGTSYPVKLIKLFGKDVTLDHVQFQKLLSQTRSIFKSVNDHHLPKSWDSILEWQAYLNTEDRKNHALPRLSPDRSTLISGGEDVWEKSHAVDSVEAYHFPKRYFPSVTGLHESWDKNDGRKTFEAVGFDKDNRMIKAAAEFVNHAKGTNINLNIERTNDKGKQVKRRIATLRITDKPNKADYDHVANCHILGEPIPTKNRALLSRSVMAIAAMVTDIKDDKIVPDVREILEKHGLQNLSEGRKRRANKEGSLTIQSLGGNNYYPLAFGGENKIGSNSILFGYTPFQKTKNGRANPKTYNLIVDNGITLLDWKRVGYEGYFADTSPYLHHRTDENHKAKADKTAILITHRHYDHDGALAMVYKQGFYADVVYCTPKTQAALERSMSQNNVPKWWRPNYNIIDPNSSFEMFPDLKFSSYALQHSTPNIAFRLDSPTRHVGVLPDFLLQPKEKTKKSKPHAGPEKYASTESLLKKFNGVDLMLMETTRVLSEGYNTTLGDIKTYYNTLLSTYPDKRIINAMFSTKEDLIVAVAEVAAQHRKIIVIDGARMEETYGWLNKFKIYDPSQNKKVKFKSFIAQQGGDIVKGTSKLGRNLLRSGSAKAFVIATGPTDESYSTMYKLARDEHPRLSLDPLNDVVVISNSEIPGTKKGIKHSIYAENVERLVKGIGVPVVTPYMSLLPDIEKHPIYSGHSSEKNIEYVISKIDCKFLMPIHGEVAHHAKFKELLHKQNKTAVIVNNQPILEVRRKKVPKIIGRGDASVVYYLSDNPDGVVKHVTEYACHTPSIRFHGIKEDMLNKLSEAHDTDKPDPKYSLVTPLFQDPHMRPSLFYEDNSHGQRADSLGIVQKVFFDIEGTDKGRSFVSTHFAAIKHDEKTGDKHEVEYRQKLMPYTLVSPIACVITNATPQEMRKKGDTSPVYMHNVYSTLLQPPVGPEGEKKIEVLTPAGPIKLLRKNLLIGHNIIRFDRPKLEREFMMAGFADFRMTQRGRALFYDTLPTSRLFAIFKPEAFKTTPNKETGFASFKLGDLVDSNNLRPGADEQYATFMEKNPNRIKDHDPVYDNFMCEELFYHQKSVDADLQDWLIVNSHKRTLKNYILGTGRGFRWNKPIVSYLGFGEKGYEARMGYAVTLEHEKSHGSKAIMLRLEKDPEELATLSDDDLHKRFNEFFDVLNLNKQPGIVPGKYGLEINANKELSEATLQTRKYFVENNPLLVARIRKVATHLMSSNGLKIPVLPDELETPYSEKPLEKWITSNNRELLKTIQPDKWMLDTTKEEMKEHFDHINNLRLNNTCDENTRMLMSHIIYQNAPKLLKNDKSVLHKLDTFYRYHEKGPLGGVYLSRQRIDLELKEIEENMDKFIDINPRTPEILKAYRDDLAKITKNSMLHPTHHATNIDIRRRNRDNLNNLNFH